MPDRMARMAGRSPVAHFETIAVYRDSPALSYQELMGELESQAEILSISSVLGILHDASPGGVGLTFEGQQLRAQTLLQPDQPYLLELTLSLPQVPDALAPYLKIEASRQRLLVRAVCRWDQVTEGLSRVGFEFLQGNPPAVLQFLAERLGTRRLP